MRYAVLIGFLCGFLCVSCAPMTYGHSGGTDSSGCHTNSSTGDRHCHNSGGVSTGGGGTSSSSGGNDNTGAIIGLSIAAAVGIAAVTLIAVTSSNNHSRPGTSDQSEGDSNGECCKVCSRGKPCGDTCISVDYECHQPPGCAC